MVSETPSGWRKHVVSEEKRSKTRSLTLSIVVYYLRCYGQRSLPQYQ